MKVRATRVMLLLSVLIAVAACSRATAVPQADAPAVASATSPTAGAGEAVTTTTGAGVTAPLTRTAALTDTAGVAGNAGAAGVASTTGVTATSATTSTLAGDAGKPAITEPITAITRTLTYADPAAFYAFDYPAAWTLTPYAGAVAMLTSFPLEGPGRGGIASGETKMDFTPDLELTRTDLEQMVAQTRAQTTVIGESDVLLSGGVAAKRMTLRGPAGDEMALLLTVIGGRGLRVLGYGDLTLFDAIVRTLRAAK